MLKSPIIASGSGLAAADSSLSRVRVRISFGGRQLIVRDVTYVEAGFEV